MIMNILLIDDSYVVLIIVSYERDEKFSIHADQKD